jgi:hypothetical protein
VDQPDGVDEPVRVDASSRNEFGHKRANRKQINLKIRRNLTEKIEQKTTQRQLIKKGWAFKTK